MFTGSRPRKDTPFRVSIHHQTGAFVLKLEGPFRAADAPEVEARWRTAASLLGSQPFVVDLAAATSVEPAARDLLIRMRDSGADLVAGGPEPVRLATGIASIGPDERLGRKCSLRRTLEGFPALVACLFTHMRAWAG
jgi:hypothetical protein